MVMHAPGDDTVPISNAVDIFTAAKHPKSFVSLDSADHLLTRRVHHHQGAPQRRDLHLQIVLAGVLDELALDAERPPGQLHLRLAVARDRVQVRAEQAGHVRRIAGRGHGDDGGHLRHLIGGGQHGRAAEAVADQQARRRVVVAQEVGGGHQVGQVGREIGVGELALARAQACLLYTSPSPRDRQKSRMPSSA